MRLVNWRAVAPSSTGRRDRSYRFVIRCCKNDAVAVGVTDGAIVGDAVGVTVEVGEAVAVVVGVAVLVAC